MALTPEGYRPRLIDAEVEAMLESFGAVSIEGPRWCGKTWTAENHSRSEFRVADAVGPVPGRDIAASDPRGILMGEEPRLIDEWQEVPAIWDAVRSEVDRGAGKGRFLLTGSSIPRRKEYVHSGTGRIGRIRMRTMTLLESGDSDGSVSLFDLFNGTMEQGGRSEPSLDSLIRLAIRGGWPGAIGTKGDPGRMARDYIEHAAEDAACMDGRERSRRKMEMLIRSLSRNESTLASNAKVMSDMREHDNESISPDTYSEYADCLYRMHLTDDTPAFSPNVRSDARVGKASKRHLTDVSLSIAALRLNHQRLKADLSTFGLMFEALCEHDLQIYSECSGGRMFHYRDGRGREADAVVETADGDWGLFEIKLGTGQVDAAAENLLSLSRFFTENGDPPSLQCVVCGLASYAYRRPDGVYVVPLTSLGP